VKPADPQSFLSLARALRAAGKPKESASVEQNGLVAARQAGKAETIATITGERGG